MSSKRATILMGILVVLLLIYFINPPWIYEYKAAVVAPPLPGKNTISNLKVHRDDKGKWIADFDYFYTGEPHSGIIELYVTHQQDSAGTAGGGFKNTFNAERGAHHAHKQVNSSQTDAVSTTHVVVKFFNEKEGSGARVAQNIDWPDYWTRKEEEKLASMSPDEVIKEAVIAIDKGGEIQLQKAKRLLEHVLIQDPKFSPAYVEMARVAMKQNWGAEGLREADGLLSSALKIQPDNTDAKILLGYVYTHQKRFKDAEILFTEVSGTNTKNLWLWANWGQLHKLQGKPDLAIEKYRKALENGRPHNSYDRARLEAYNNQIALLGKNLDQVEALHKQRVAEFGSADCNCSNHCFIAEYVHFLVQNRDDTSSAIKMGRQAMNSTCKKDEAREAMGLAHYAAWVRESDKGSEDSLMQARVFLPPSPNTLYLLAGSDRTSLIIKKLVSVGESIDQLDNQGNNALLLALANSDLLAAKRLLKLGARTDTPIGIGKMPVALIPVIEENLTQIRLMRQFGVDYSKLRFDGITAIEYAKKNGKRELLDALDPKRSFL